MRRYTTSMLQPSYVARAQKIAFHELTRSCLSTQADNDFGNKVYKLK
ncbi:hypothetical protein [Flavihumibacter fluvii]|nr:hypothetical protein [Flavihumibacter fluvii]ULQ50913.1 hypothetical protein KJS93_12545 [Flavihumibacter fluvii]